MKTLSSLEIKAVVEELQELVEAKVDQVYQPDNTEITISLHKTELGKSFLRIIPGQAIYLATKRRPSPKEAVNFCRFLRKRIGPTRLKQILQKKGERIVEFYFEGKESAYILIAEFFSKGNLILCDKDYMILSALQLQFWKDRKIKAKIKYEYPPERKIFFENLEEFKKSLKEKKKESIVKTLALSMNLGGVYAEELCFRAQLDKNAKDLTEKEQERLFRELEALLKEPLHPNLINDNPVPFKMQSLGEGTAFTTYNEALDHYYSPYMETGDEEKEAEKKTKKQKTETMWEEQEKQKLLREKAREENRKKGEWIYMHYMELKELLDLFEKKKYDEIKKKGGEVEGKNILLEIP